MADTFSESIKQSRRIKSLPQRMILPKKELDSYYNHFTLRIETLADYVNIVSRLSKISDRPEFGKLVFRGHSDASSNYKLIPTLGRTEKSLEQCENSLVTEMQKLRPEEFDNINSNFDLLSKLQHFGIPTRLLDFTYNPLIALYFACCSNKKLDGRIICTYDTSSSFTTNTIESVCGMYKYIDYHATYLDKVIGGTSKIVEYSLNTAEPLMARPKYSNDRIKLQSAVFMVFPNVVMDLRSLMVIAGKNGHNEKDYRMFPWNDLEERRITYLRDEPDVYSQANGFYFKTKTMRKLFHYYSKKYDDFYIGPEVEINEKYHFLFKNRFSIEDQLQELSEEDISNGFISIVVESKYKNEIIKDLASIGIDKSFVFPELEYTAETVKNRFFK